MEEAPARALVGELGIPSRCASFRRVSCSASSARYSARSNDRAIKRIVPLIEQINAIEPELRAALGCRAAGAHAGDFRQRLENGRACLDDLLPDAFAVVREAAKRTLGQRHYDVQLIGGVVLHRATSPR